MPGYLLHPVRRGSALHRKLGVSPGVELPIAVERPSVYGSLSQETLSAAIRTLQTRQASGILHIFRENESKRIYFKAGKIVSNYVHPKTLTHRERDMLVQGFKAIRALRDRIRSEFTGDVF